MSLHLQLELLKLPLVLFEDLFPFDARTITSSICAKAPDEAKIDAPKKAMQNAETFPKNF